MRNLIEMEIKQEIVNYNKIHSVFGPDMSDDMHTYAFLSIGLLVVYEFKEEIEEIDGIDKKADFIFGKLAKTISGQFNPIYARKASELLSRHYNLL